MVTILIPTAKRPDYLQKALESVAAQTAISEIAEIIVSESAGDSRSGEVCRLFPQLPIKYILRDPQMTMVEHFSALKKARWSGEFTVMLHDDDWWTPDFLRKAIDALNAHPEAVTFCCLSYNVTGERAPEIECDSIPIFFFWFGANFPLLQPLWGLSREEMLMTCILNTPAHYSTILARAEAFQKSAVIYETGNNWDVDRMFLFELSAYGTTLFSPIAYAYYRRHTLQITTTFRIKTRKERARETTEWIIERSGENREALARRLYEQIRQCPDKGRRPLYYNFAMPWALPTLVAPLDQATPVARFSKRLRTRMRLRKAFRFLLPPLLFSKIEARFFRPLE